MRKFDFFTENGRNLFGERFGRAIEYNAKVDELQNKIDVEFKPSIVLGENEAHDCLLQKNTLVCLAIFSLTYKYDYPIHVYFNVYGEKLIATKKDTVTDIEEKIKEIQLRYLEKIDIY